MDQSAKRLAPPVSLIHRSARVPLLLYYQPALHLPRFPINLHSALPFFLKLSSNVDAYAFLVVLTNVAEYLHMATESV